jgi:hypothetical protein
VVLEPGGWVKGLKTPHHKRLACYKMLKKKLPISSLKLKITVLHVVLYGCETWFPTLRNTDEGSLRRIFGPKREELQMAEED